MESRRGRNTQSRCYQRQCLVRSHSSYISWHVQPHINTLIQFTNICSVQFHKFNLLRDLLRYHILVSKRRGVIYYRSNTACVDETMLVWRGCRCRMSFILKEPRKPYHIKVVRGLNTTACVDSKVTLLPLTVFGSSISHKGWNMRRCEDICFT